MNFLTLTYQGKGTQLNNEYNALRETYDRIQSKDGFDYLCQNDSALKGAAEDLYKALLEQAKKDAMIREKLEQRYEKVISEILKLEKEREAFIDDSKPKMELLSKVYRIFNGTKDSHPIRNSYTFTRPGAYSHLGKVKDRP